MCMPPEKRKPTSAKVGSQNAKALHGAFDREDTISPALLQASLIRRRFDLSWPLALTIAELAYQAGRRQ